MKILSIGNWGQIAVTVFDIVLVSKKITAILKLKYEQILKNLLRYAIFVDFKRKK